MSVARASRLDQDYDLLRQPDVQAFFDELSKDREILFVTGCARSGTSLLQRCLSTVHQPVYFWSENTLAEIYKQGRTAGAYIVLKRTASCHRHFDAIPPAVKVIHIVRDPRDVFTSKVRGRDDYYVSPQRWADEFRAFEVLETAHQAQNLAVVRYEDLLADADAEQQRLARELGIAFDLPFSRYFERSALDEKIDKFTKQRRIWEPIDPTRPQLHRVGDDRAARFSAVRQEIEPELARFAARFGYDLHR